MRLRYVSIALCLVLVACKKPAAADAVNTSPPTDTTQFIKGADVSWLTQMEAEGRKFYNSAGVEQDCLRILKDLGMNTVRLRVWVNPANGWNNTADVVTKAVRAKKLGLQVMIDFHYSDSWADPGKQYKPATWSHFSFDSLQQALSEHTQSVLTALKSNGVTPKWVQVGNENDDGMLWPEGKASSGMSNFAELIDAGYAAVKSVDPSIQVIVHISNGWNNGLFRWIFDGLKNNGARWDIIGMSLYPSTSDWANKNEQCLANMNDMVARYHKDVMIVEVGMPWDQPEACYSFLTDLIAKVKSVTNGHGLGVLYWEPESYDLWQGYTLGAFDNSGKPTAALDAFK